jgi:hypothetical protein
MHDIFIVDDFINTDVFKINEIQWDNVIAGGQVGDQVRHLINYVPECVPFKVRALVFHELVTKEKYINKGSKFIVKIRRGQEFNDGFTAFKEILNIKGTLMIQYINEYGI